MRDTERTGSIPDPLIRSMADRAPSALVLTCGRENRIIYANQAFVRLTGRQAALVLGANIAEVVPGMDLSALTEACLTKQQVRRTGQPLSLPPGEGTTWWDFCSIYLDDMGPDGAAVMTTAQEVTGHIVARRDAEAAQATLDALMAHIPEGITIARGPGVQVERVSAHGKALTRKTDAELLGIDAQEHPEVWQVYAPGSDVPLPPGERPLARAISRGEVMENRTLMLRCPDGSMLPVLCSSGPITDSEGRITGAVLAWRDIKDLHDAQKTARESNDRLALALRAGGLGTWETDLSTNLTRWDARLAEMLGLPHEATTAEAGRLSELIHPDDRERVTGIYMSAGRSGSPFAAEFRVMSVQGEERWLASQGVWVGGRAIGVVHDVTERRRKEERLQQALADRDLLVREADHRIKNSLQLIAGLLALQQARLSDPEASAALSDAIARVRAVGETHKSLNQSSDLKTVDFGQTLSDICEHIGDLTTSVTLTCRHEGDLKLDAERAIPLGLLVSELLTNASKHAYPQGVAGLVSAQASSSQGELVVCVVDQGVGSPDIGTIQGAGLGGSIVRGLAKQIGATVDVASSPGSGTTITVRLPLKPVAPTPVAAQPKS